MENSAPASRLPAMPASSFNITQITSPAELHAHLPSLSTILQSCVDEGSSIGFLAPLSPAEAQAYWTSLLPGLENQTLHLFILTSSPPASATSPAPAPAPASSQPAQILSTIQLSTLTKPAHAHRAEVQKLLVLPSARKMGIARRLMGFIEGFARELGKEVLILDTATESPAREMYGRFGWEEWGTCKGYAVWTDGSKCDATFFRKEL